MNHSKLWEEVVELLRIDYNIYPKTRMEEVASCTALTG